MQLSYFADTTLPLIKPALAFFDKELNIKLVTDSFKALQPKLVFKTPTKAEQEVLKLVAPDGFFFLGTIDKGVINPSPQLLLYASAVLTMEESIERLATSKCEGIMVFGMELLAYPTRTQLATFSRALNRLSREAPVMVLFRHPANPESQMAAPGVALPKLVSLATSERSAYKRADKQGLGEKVGKVALLRDMNPGATHAGHLRTLLKLRVNDPASKQKTVTTYGQLYEQWRTVFDVQVLNNAFYADLTAWYYHALGEIKLPFKPDHENDANNRKNFLIRLIARTLFSWFLKEKGLIPAELLELEDLQRKRYLLLRDQAAPAAEFLASNSYYRGILQNIFFHSLNRPQKTGKKAFTCTSYLPADFDYTLLTTIPYLNGGIFDQLEEDNCQEALPDEKLRVPNRLFYGAPAKGKTKEQRGLNQILNSYAFTIEENTPAEEVIALDPELLGLVFESLLAELDPNLEEKTRNSIRKLTGSFYTPRKVIQEMVNESLFLHLNNYFRTTEGTAAAGQLCPVYAERLRELLYANHVDAQDKGFCKGVVQALDQLKVLDPACGSGAFPMGMLQRVVQLLQLVDPKNDYWLKLQLARIPDAAVRADFETKLRGQISNYSRKLGIIKNCIYGIDIQPLAVQITKLRFFITLLIDQRLADPTAENRGINPMPNLETKVVCANSLTTYSSDRSLFNDEAVRQLAEAHEQYYTPNLTAAEKDKITDTIVQLLHGAVPTFAKDVTGHSTKDESRNRALLREWFQHGTVSAPFFDADLFFPELHAHGGFDIVIGNPPYGGTPITKELATALDLGSRDPYGAFVTRFLGDGQNYAPLRKGGVLAFIVSDTFMTIGTHLKLRQKLLHNYVHKMIRVHPDTFRATVNTVILVAERNLYDIKLPIDQKKIPDSHVCQMVDLTQVSIHQQHDRFLDLLHETEGFTPSKKNVATPEFAVYYYPQQLIRTNSNLPFFVASPKLFGLLNDTGREVPKETVKLGGQEVSARVVTLNGHAVRVVKLGQIAEVRVGLQTGDNHAYLFQHPEARGTYRSIDEYRQFLLTEADLQRIRTDDDLRRDIIAKGISKGNKQSKRYFEGRYIAPFDKGGESDVDEGWMPNYYVPTNYFIDWSEWAVKRMDTFTIAERIRAYGEEKAIIPSYETTTCAVIRNPSTYFQKGLTFSPTGIYSPTFRINSNSVYGNKGSNIFINSPTLKPEYLLGILCSKFIKYVGKNYQSHTVEMPEGQMIELPILTTTISPLKTVVNKVISKQKREAHYDYATHEQLEIDRLVYQAYGLNEEDIAEVEAWYARRYPRLVRPPAKAEPTDA